MIRVFGLVPARGGSKGVPRKNVRLLAGKPLLQYTAEAALGATRLSRVLLSTEDEEIASVGRRCGLEVPFLRPVELARDDTPSLPVVQHAVRWMETTGERFDAVCLLQPTSPLRRAEDIDACISLLEGSGADAVVTVRPVPLMYNPHWTYVQRADGSLELSTGERSPIPRRQDLPPAFHRDGSISVTRCEVVLERDSLYGECLRGYVANGVPWVDLDDVGDWAHAEELVQSGAIQ